jgi:hypothetical protein
LQPQPEATPAQTNGVDPEVARALQSPKIREAIAQQVQASEQARQSYLGAIQQMGQVATANLYANFPELQKATTPESFAAVMQAVSARDPARAQAIANHIGATKQHLAAVQQQTQQYQAAVAQQTKSQMDAWDDQFDEGVKNENPETVKRVRSEIGRIAETHYGLSGDDLARAWQNEAWIHHPAVQRMMYDAAKWHLAQEAVQKARPVNRPVMRPGEVDVRGGFDGGLVEATKSFIENPSVKSGAKRLAALRAHRANNQR